MKSNNSHLQAIFQAEPKSRSCVFTLLVIVSLVCGAYFICSAWLGSNCLRPLAEIEISDQLMSENHYEFELSSIMGIEQNQTREEIHLDGCNDKFRPSGTEALPKGIVTTKSNLEMQSLWDSVNKIQNKKMSLLAMAVGIKQKQLVDKIVNKFLDEDFVVMLFHYDGFSGEWEDVEWNERVIHVSAKKQTKWWFAKRFLHPDIVDEYKYIFLWDEDIGVDNFNPSNYLSIIKEEGLEISQPALDPKYNVHHLITSRRKGLRVHRRYYRSGKCEANNTSPPCLGWVEMMVPVFSQSAWRCVWHMIQNDLIHAWGLDFQLGYCAQGDRMQSVGIVDEEYVAHLGIPTLGGVSEKDMSRSSSGDTHDRRSDVRMRSYKEMSEFKNRWNKAVEEDDCWIDPYKKI